MSIQRKTLQLVQGNLKGTRLCKDVLVVLPTEHLLRGFRKVKGPREFLKHVNWMAGNTMVNLRIDLALTHYMVGECA